MTPAFSSTRHALWFGLVLSGFLTLPLTTHWIGRVPLEQSYRGISERAGAFDYIRREIFEESGPVDVLFCGSSLLRNAVDVAVVKREMSRALGRQASVILLPQSWQGPDLNYYVARDFLERRPVKILVLAAPALIHHSSQPHVQLFRVVRYGDHPGALEGLGPRSRLATYAEFVLGAPRQALNVLRPNPLGAEAMLKPDTGSRLGYMGASFVPRPAEAPPLDARRFLAFDRSNPAFHFDAPDLNAYQLHYLEKTVELARRHGTLLVVLHMPSPSERGRDTVPWQRDSARLFGPNVVLAAIPSASMFRGVSPDQYFDYFQDEHLNANGMALFTKEFAPALIELYEQHR
jgi:hypothetical protein